MESDDLSEHIKHRISDQTMEKTATLRRVEYLSRLDIGEENIFILYRNIVDPWLRR